MIEITEEEMREVRYLAELQMEYAKVINEIHYRKDDSEEYLCLLP